MLQHLVPQVRTDEVFRVVLLCPSQNVRVSQSSMQPGEPLPRRLSGYQLTSSVCISHGGGGNVLSKFMIVSSATFVYLLSVWGPSCRSRDCRRYRHPFSTGEPGHDEVLSVSSQSDVSSLLHR